ncbi:glutamine--fructose-6-phosphate aminotransferase [isomerizing] [Alphaproteobacteria bacterium]|nr:glutamine--fructose-6-phosphate aminotransferase [isomerizing] [Alphaproteobacteria bacterium]
MCGIVSVLAVVGDVVSWLISALKRLEYRGYDSAGIAYIEDGKVARKRAVGRVDNLRVSNDFQEKIGVGIGHTRWATHGLVSVQNAHPHIADGVAIVHNGIIENYIELKEFLIENGENFESETDSEVIAKYIAFYIKQGENFIDSVKYAVKKLKGTYSIAAIYDKEPDILIGAKHGSPLAVGYSSDKKSIFVASDAIALSSLAEDIIYLEDGDTVICGKNNDAITFKIYDKFFKKIERNVCKNSVLTSSIDKSGYDDFMLKEIFEEPKAIIDAFNNYEKIDISNYKNIVFIACGTSYYAGLLAKYWLEEFAHIHVDIEIASEFRYRNPVMSEDSLFVLISQSGETIDTLCALRSVKEKGFKTVAIVNVDASSIAREADHIIRICAGPEIGVASTKAFVAQMMCLLLFCFDKKNIDINEIINSVNFVLNSIKNIEKFAENLIDCKSLLYIGRGASYPIALEGALKAKELAYISSDGYPAGEIKHGPIALIDELVYSIILAPKDRYFDKTISNAQEILARKGKVLFITNADINFENSQTLLITTTSDFLFPFALATSIHLLAYYIAKLKDLDVDKPRNLAKSVTVE